MPADISNPIFNHSGNMGDIIYSLCFVKEWLEAEHIPLSTATYNIQINQPARYSVKSKHPCGDVMINQSVAEYLKPLLEYLGFSAVTVNENKPDASFDLSEFRRLRINKSAGDIRSWYYELSDRILPKDFQRKILTLPANSIDSVHDKIVITLTSRYRNALLDLMALKPLAPDLVFLGLDDEYRQFCSEFFDVDRIATSDAMQTALILNSASCFIGNVSGNYAIAEQLKCPRILFTPEVCVRNGKLVDGPVNVLPQGGRFELIRTQNKLNAVVRRFKEGA